MDLWSMIHQANRPPKIRIILRNSELGMGTRVLTMGARFELHGLTCVTLSRVNVSHTLQLGFFRAPASVIVNFSGCKFTACNHHHRQRSTQRMLPLPNHHSRRWRQIDLLPTTPHACSDLPIALRCPSPRE